MPAILICRKWAPNRGRNLTCLTLTEILGTSLERAIFSVSRSCAPAPNGVDLCRGGVTPESSACARFPCWWCCCTPSRRARKPHPVLEKYFAACSRPSAQIRSWLTVRGPVAWASRHVFFLRIRPNLASRLRPRLRLRASSRIPLASSLSSFVPSTAVRSVIIGCKSKVRMGRSRSDTGPRQFHLSTPVRFRCRMALATSREFRACTPSQ